MTGRAMPVGGGGQSGRMFLLREGSAPSSVEDGASSVVFSASDLVVAAACEFAVLRRLDVRLGRAQALPQDADPVLERTALLGGAHEARVLEDFRKRFGGGVVEIPAAWTSRRSSLTQAHEATVLALREGADVVY